MYFISDPCLFIRTRGRTIWKIEGDRSVLSGFELIETTLKEVDPDVRLLVLTAAAILFAGIWVNNRRGRIIGLASLFGACVFLFPPAAKALGSMMREGTTYWRFLWVIPSSILIAYMASELTGRIRSWFLQAAAAAFFLAVIVLTGRNLYLGGVFEKAENPEKLPAIVLTIDRTIREQEADSSSFYARLAAPPEIANKIRQYDGDILGLSYSRNWGTKSDDPDSLFDDYERIMLGTQTDERGILPQVARYFDANYIALKTEFGYRDMMESEGYEEIYSDSEWELWYDPAAADLVAADG
jgi:hypothetical protein